ncbi:histidine utilization repressor [Ramlibacter sp. 2FC]|uniref:histidine utilization repressor n=1 Tax=Ramlibacter sp. 2FC TaxID=2502188 RepID=UPI0010F8C79D|nr:histidine utilization repressor [Ramlibacter sp. 2FC]
MEPLPPTSLHQRILSEIEELILSGRWPPGFHLPSELELAESYGCSRMTANKALTQLARTGLIERRRKAGSFVMRSQSRSAVLQIQDIRAEVAELGLPYHYQILQREQRRSGRADRERLVMAQTGPVLALACLHYAGERPFCLEDRLINLAVVPEAAEEAFAELAPGAWLFGRVPWTSAEHRIRAEGADAETARALKLRKGTPCLVIERRTWSSEHPVTQVRLSYPGEGRELVARFSPTQG